MSDSKKVAVYVTVYDEKAGEYVNLEPGDTVPASVKDQVGEHCFKDANGEPFEVVAGPSQGVKQTLEGLSDEDLELLKEARAAAAKRKAGRRGAASEPEPTPEPAPAEPAAS